MPVIPARRNELDARTFIETARNNPGRWLRVTFVKSGEGIAALARLRRAYCGPDRQVQIDKIDDMTASAVCMTRNWDGDRNRTVKFTGLHNLDDNTLAQFARDIEKIAV